MTASQAQTTHAVRHPRLQVDYVDQTDPGVLLADPQVLAVFGFGD
ncbi:pteridine-dependent deoxygenase, partial [Xanthomonas oryzae pv. oryzae]